MSEQDGDAIPQGIKRSSGEFTQQGFEFGEELLDRVEVWAVGGKEHQFGAGGFNGSLHGGSLVRAQVVHDDDIAGRQSWEQKLLYPVAKELSVYGAVDDARRGDGIMAQGGQEGAGLPVAVRNAADQALASRGTTIEACHVGLHPGFVDEDELRRVELDLALGPGSPGIGDVRPFLLGSPE